MQVAYTLWVRFMKVLVENAALSAQWAKPVRLPFYEQNKDYLDAFEGFNLAPKLEIERTIQENTNNCDAPKPVILLYDRCSESYNQLWRSSGRSVQVCCLDCVFACLFRAPLTQALLSFHRSTCARTGPSSFRAELP